jgi:hypothetical protein
MKRITVPAFIAILFVGIASCKKENGATTPGTSLKASKTSSIKKGEPVLFTLSNSAGTSVTWHVSPALNTKVNATGANASVMFGSRGAYTVTAVSGGSTDSSIVTVTDSSYIPPPQVSTTLPFVNDEEIKITASKLDSAWYSGIILLAQTVNTYPCLSNYLLSAQMNESGSYGIDFLGVSIPYGCTTGPVKAGAFEYLLPMADGTNALTITLKGVIYRGSIVKAGNSYTINWSYTSGVTISPSTL